MARPGLRARALTRYFSDEYGFEPENHIAGVILYKRLNAQGVVERIVIKHATMPVWGQQPGARDDEIDLEENLLRRLWGSEHTIRLMSVVDDRYHRAPVMWAPPLNRNLLNPPPILPWKLRVDPALYPNAANFGFFVMEFLARGTGPAEAQRENMKFVGELMHQLARVAEDPVEDDHERPRYTVRNIPGLTDFETYATAEFCRARNLSFDFKLLVCKCLAVDEARRPTLRPVLEVCERNAGLTPNWMNLADEVSELFDAVPLLNNGSDSDSEYTP
ncbi:hypothetical protein F4782DRAFT_550097 [Xylaria castorea]|nr:hypothetical protein F4782DRAFT_550097 [Xylaria castorea]